MNEEKPAPLTITIDRIESAFTKAYQMPDGPLKDEIIARLVALLDQIEAMLDG